MDKVKQLMGFVWLILGPALFIMLSISAINNINSNTKSDISNPIPWIIILAIFLPIAAGMCIFGLYSLKGLYSKEGTLIHDNKV